MNFILKYILILILKTSFQKIQKSRKIEIKELKPVDFSKSTRPLTFLDFFQTSRIFTIYFNMTENEKEKEKVSAE